MTTSEDGNGATPMDRANSPRTLNATSFMLGVLSASPEAVVRVTTPFGYIERSFNELTHEQITSLLSSLEITLTATLSTIGELTSVGAPRVRTTEIDTASSGGSTVSSSPSLADIQAIIRKGPGALIQNKPEPLKLREDFVEWASPPQPADYHIVADQPEKPEAIMASLKSGDTIYIEDASGATLEPLTIHNVYKREEEFSAYDQQGVRRVIPWNSIQSYARARHENL